MMRPFRLACAFLVALLVVLGPVRPAHADSRDIAAAARSVVRVALVATNGQSAYFVGHGSGVAVAPDKVLTNAHVVELAREEKGIIIGVIPAEGKKSYGARVIAFSPGNDLALLQITDGNLPAATFFAGAAQDGQEIVAIGYPGSVDRAQGMDLADIIQPMSPVKTVGTISGGRSSKQFDTILHTAPMAQGNSGGPLVDDCGRVMGINSFGSLSDTNEAEYGFAVSNREIASFLRQAGVQPQRTVMACRSLAEIEAVDRAATERARLEAEQRAAAEAVAARERTLRAREDAEQAVIAGRENAMAFAALLLALSVLCAGAAGVSYTQKRAQRVRWFGAGAGVLLVGAILAFVLRPSFREVDDRAAAIANRMAADDTAAKPGANAAPAGSGNYLCRINIDRSRVTVSDTSDVPIHWDETGCVNGRTQLVRSGSGWTRTLVPNDEASVSIRGFDPAGRTYRSDKYLIDAQAAEAVRKARQAVDFEGCTTDSSRLAALAEMEANVRALLPAQPNERLVYDCTATSAPAAPQGDTPETAQ